MKLLKPLLFCFLAVYCLFPLNAQNSNKLSASVYFESGSHQLNAASIQKLENFIKEVKTFNDFELDLKAYTDDRGALSYNMKLSEKRAKSVEEYLLKATLQPNATQAKGLGELALEGLTNTKDERKQNRRVDVIATKFAPQNLGDLFSHLSEQNTQEFIRSNESEIVIYGDQGTIIDIPANAFQTKEGEDVTEVKIVLQEAYSYADMIRHNFSTTSDDKMIETGGMLYIDAIDLETGKKVELKPETNIELSMPSNEKLPDDMQLFVADNRASAGHSVNWQPTKRKFKSVDARSTKGVPFNNFRVAAKKFHPDSVKFLSDNLSFSLPVLPKKMETPQRPSKPKAPRLMKLEGFNKEKLEQKYKRRRWERKKKYKERIEKLAEQKETQYQRNQATNEKRIAKYQNDSLEYEQAIIEYEKEVVTYASYIAKLENAKLEILSKKNDMFKEIYEVEKQSRMAGYFSMSISLREQAGELLAYHKYLKRHCKQLKLNKSLEYLENLDYSVLDSLKIKLRWNNQANKIIGKNSKFWYTGIKIDNNIHNRTDYIRRYFELVGSTEGEEMDENLRELYSAIEKINKHLPTPNIALKELKALGQIYDLEAAPNTVRQLRELSSDCLSKVMEEKKEKGLLSDAELRRFYMNTISISGLGFINCDRFMNFKGEKVDLLVKHKSDPNTQFYVMFKERKSVLTLSAGSTGYSVNMYDGVPKGMAVKVVGIRILNGVTETFVHECNTEQINTMAVSFKETKLAALKNLLSNI